MQDFLTLGVALIIVMVGLLVGTDATQPVSAEKRAAMLALFAVASVIIGAAILRRESE